MLLVVGECKTFVLNYLFIPVGQIGRNLQPLGPGILVGDVSDILVNLIPCRIQTDLHGILHDGAVGLCTFYSTFHLGHPMGHIVINCH